MNCGEIQDNLSAYIDQELAPAVEDSIRTHLRMCRECSAYHTKLLRGWQALEVWDDAVPPESVRLKILESVQPQRKSGFLRAAMSVAAVLLLVFGISIYYLGLKGQSVQELPITRVPVQSASVNDISDVSEDEIIANLLILQEKDFFEVIDELVKIDELPLAEEPSGNTKEPERSSLDIVTT